MSMRVWRKIAAVVPVIIILVLTPVVAGFSVTVGSTSFLIHSSPKTVEDISLALMALSSSYNKVQVNSTHEILNLSYRLVNMQNPDGGWGYFEGSVSNVPDTSYAIVALQMAINSINNPKFDFRVYRSIMRGIDYLKSSRSSGAWGYVRASPPMYYPTVMALWALGESGYGPDSPLVSGAVSRLDNLPSAVSKPEALALKVLAFKSIGYPIENSTVREIRDYLFNGTLNVKERAMLTYALALSEGRTFDVLKAISLAETYMKRAGKYAFWVYTTKVPPTIIDDVAPTAYMLMAISTFSPRIKRLPEAPCSSLAELQNPDGGWGFEKGSPSNPVATYYALRALELCYPMNSSTIRRGISWVRHDYMIEYSKAGSMGRITPEYFYSLEMMLKFHLMNSTSKEKAVKFIDSLRLKSGLWGSPQLGPEPLDTAMALKALLDLGVSPSNPVIQNATRWLLSISNGGWGVYFGRAKYPYMVDENVLTTLMVIEALEGVVNSTALAPHIRWLLNQRIDNGWPYMKNYTVAFGNETFIVSGKPRLDLTVRATLLLEKFGYNYINDTMSFVLYSLQNASVRRNTLYMASAVYFLLSQRVKPPVTLSDVSDLIRTGKVRVLYEGSLSRELITAIRSSLGNVSIKRISSRSNVSGASIVMLPVNSSFVLGNPYFNISGELLKWPSGSIRLNGSEIVMVPGLLPGGPVLFVICGNQHVLSEVISTGYLGYMQGYAAVVRFTDRNHDGRIELNEITLEQIG